MKFRLMSDLPDQCSKDFCDGIQILQCRSEATCITWPDVKRPSRPGWGAKHSPVLQKSRNIEKQNCESSPLHFLFSFFTGVRHPFSACYMPFYIIFYALFRFSYHFWRFLIHFGDFRNFRKFSKNNIFLTSYADHVSAMLQPNSWRNSDIGIDLGSSHLALSWCNSIRPDLASTRRWLHLKPLKKYPLATPDLT